MFSQDSVACSRVHLVESMMLIYIALNAQTVNALYVLAATQCRGDVEISRDIA